MTVVARRAHVMTVPDARALAEAGARVWVDAVRHALAARGAFHVALSGSRTPQPLYRRVAEEPDLDYAWHRTHVWWGDERAVPPSSPESNYGMARASLLDFVPLPEDQVHRMEADAPDPEGAARRYETDLAAALGRPELPVLDLVWLGVGADGHTASLFPGSTALAERVRWVTVSEAPVEPRRRMTLTLPVLRAARRVCFVVSGADKAEVVRAVLEGPDDPERLPAQAVRPDHGRLLWLLDEAAAARLSGPSGARASRAPFEPPPPA